MNLLKPINIAVQIIRGLRYERISEGAPCIPFVLVIYHVSELTLDRSRKAGVYGAVGSQFKLCGCSIYNGTKLDVIQTAIKNFHWVNSK